MLKKSHRLSTKEFMEVMEKGRVHHSPIFIVRVIKTKENGIRQLAEKTENGDRVKISAVAPKKVASTAVLRNKTRRLIYESVQPLVTSIVPGTHMIIFAKQEAIKSHIKTMTLDLQSLFSKAKISV